jgi:ethanolamine utilization protein
MVNQTFIEEVIEELYKRLQINVNPNIKKVIILFGEVPKTDLISLTNIYEVIPYREGIIDYDSIVNYDAIVISNMAIDMLGSIATGCCHRTEELFILKALLKEKSVYIIDSGMEYKQYKETAFKNLYSLYSDYENKLIQYGMKRITNILELLNDVKAEQITTNMAMDVDLTYKNLILESDLSKVCRKGFTSITIKDRCIITPLALDYMKDHYIKINRV